MIRILLERMKIAELPLAINVFWLLNFIKIAIKDWHMMGMYKHIHEINDK